MSSAALTRAARVYHIAAPVPGTPAEIRKEIFSRALRLVTKAQGMGTPAAALSAAGIDFDRAYFCCAQAHRVAERGGDFEKVFADLLERFKNID